MIRQLTPFRYIYIAFYDGSPESIKDVEDMCKMASNNNTGLICDSVLVGPPNDSLVINVTDDTKRESGPGMNMTSYDTLFYSHKEEFVVLDFEQHWTERFTAKTAEQIKEKYGVDPDLPQDISLSEFEKAKQVVTNYYAQDFIKLHGSERPCICCDAKIKPIHPEHIRFPQSGMYHGGTVDKISAGYGSDVDGDMFIIAICDECVKRLRGENKIQYAGNYMNMY